MKKLLNIDGGGVRVYFPLLILNYIEQKTGKKIVDLFDFYSGVSASSIILAGILTNYSVQEIIDKFKTISSIIFYRSYAYTIKSGFGIFNSKYPDYYINEEFQKFYSGLKLSDVKKPLTILTYDLATTKPKCFHSYKENNDYNLWEVIRASTAAPTYFPAFEIDEHILIDGGIVANNLSELIFTHALTYYGIEEEYFQISMGTGSYNPKLTTPPSGLWSWSGSIMNVLFSAASTNDMNNLKRIGKYDNLKHFYRLDINLDDDITLDDYTAFEKMDQVFEKWLSENQVDLDKICEELVLCSNDTNDNSV